MSITITDTMVGLALIALAPATVLVWFFLHQARMDKKHRSLMWRTFMFGTLAIIPVFVINKIFSIYLNFDIQGFLYSYTLSKNILYIFLGCLLIAGIEEFSKSIIVKEIDWKQKEFSRIVDGIEFSVAAGLGFAFAENIYYFWTIYNMTLSISGNLLHVMVVRSILTMMAHAVFSGIFGYYYGKARVMNLKYQRLNKKHRSYNLHILHGLKIRFLRIKYLLLSKNLHKEIDEKIKEKELIGEGLLVAIILHTLYNFFLTYEYPWVSVIIIATEFYIILHEFRIHKSDKLV